MEADRGTECDGYSQVTCGTIAGSSFLFMSLLDPAPTYDHCT